MRFRASVFTVTAVALVAFIPAAHAAFHGAAGKIAFVQQDQIWAVNPDGSDLGLLIDVPGGTEGEPAWSADGARIAFEHRVSLQTDIWTANADGSNANAAIGNGRTPTWSPDGERIAFARYASSTLRADLFTARADGTDVTQLAGSPHNALYPSWSPDGTKIAFDGVAYVGSSGGPTTHVLGGSTHPDWSPFGDEIALISRNVNGLVLAPLDGRSPYKVTDAAVGQAAFSPNGAEFAYRVERGVDAVSYDGLSIRRVITLPAANNPPSAVAWQPVPTPPPPRYVRPKGATPFTASLVQSYMACESPNREHGPPLAFGSCAQPRQTSTSATVGTPDANTWPARSVGFVNFEPRVGDPATAQDEADVAITVRISDVRMRAGNYDYPWALDMPLVVRITDGGSAALQTTVPELKENTASYYTSNLRVVVPCAATADPAEGALCAITTSADAILGAGAVKERDRAIWELGQARVLDAGPDGYTDTRDDNEVFAVQGIFVP